VESAGFIAQTLLVYNVVRSNKYFYRFKPTPKSALKMRLTAAKMITPTRAAVVSEAVEMLDPATSTIMLLQAPHRNCCHRHPQE
jgi:hypothetical protein